MRKMDRAIRQEGVKQTHGGKRAGAGRKTSASPYKEKTKVMRIPESQVGVVKEWLGSLAAKRQNLGDFKKVSFKSRLDLNLFSHKVAAGFPSPADDYLEEGLDLNEYLVKNPSATFLVKVQGDSMQDAGILPGDLLAVDRSKNPQSGDIVIAAVDGELTVKRLEMGRDATYLVAENPNFEPIKISADSELVVWGVVVSVVRKF